LLLIAALLRRTDDDAARRFEEKFGEGRHRRLRQDGFVSARAKPDNVR
jgi:hypothetical protein